MPANLSYNLFGLLNQASTNDTSRPATVLLEQGQTTVAISSNSATVNVPTGLDEVLGIIVTNFTGANVPTAFFANVGNVSSGSVTVNIRATVANGNYNMRYFLVGKKE